MARLIQLTDLHIIGPGGLVSGKLDTPALLKTAVDRLLDKMDALGPLDAILLTGDISDDGSPESYDTVCAELGRLGLPILAVPGNHDRREPMRAAFSNMPGMPDTGLIDWAADIAGARIVGLDTLVEGQAGGRLRPESLALLADAVKKTGGRGLTVALHHPPLRTGIRFMDRIGLENPDEFAAVMSECETPVRILAGHVHGVYHGQIGPHSVLSAPSLCSAFALDLRENAPVGFMTGPTGCAVFDTDPGGVWTALTLGPADGPYPFQPDEKTSAKSD